MLQLQWESQQPFSFVIILQFRLLASCLSWSFLFLYHILLNLLILPCLIIVSFFTLSTTTISGLLASIMWPYYMVKSEKVLKFLFSTTLSESCSYQKFALLNPSLSQNCHYTYLSTLSRLRLYPFWASLPHSLTVSDIV